ncbi:hypothetical protein PBRA_006404 [Plasmodiophora brassicae]|uniref:DUF4395 domain-containing protein n=1 Tax=Plasmodiophora brassicae TaxID=37360 RepID=A0A0G4ISP6_PLABS|nr:hypothetical protein PBRA_006404 [Plasmodiophora brassicae]
MLRKDVFPRFVNDCIHRQHLAISREMCYWWRRRPVHLLGFPNPVNELEARLHSACVTALTVAHIVLLYEYDVSALGWFILYGFTARVVSGPRFDPQAYLVVLVLRPLLEDVLQVAKSSFKPSPPKRFAQFVGVLFALTATVIDHGFGLTFVSAIVWGCLAAAAAVLALFGFCAACYVFSLAVQAGIVPPAYCESCAYSYTTKKARPKPTATKVVCKRVTSPRTQTETP